MKERVYPEVHEGLTPRPQNPYPKGGDIFMDNKDFMLPQESLIRHADRDLNFSPKSSEAVFLSESLKRPGLSGIKKSELRGELVKFVEEFAQKAEDKPLLNPFENWNNDRLRNEYLGLLGVQSKIQKDTSFEEAEKFSGKMRVYHSRLIDELSRRGIDTSELFLHAAQKSEEGNEIRSIGAATITDRFADLRLQGIIEELNDKVNIVGEGNPLDPQFIRDAAERVRDYRDENPEDLAIRREANQLLIRLNAWMEEARAGAERRRGGELDLSDEAGTILDNPDLTSEAKYQGLKELIDKYPLNAFHPIPKTFIQEISRDAKATAYFIDRVISWPFDFEEESYQAPAYGKQNIDEMLNILLKDGKRDLHAFYATLEPASLLSHNMNYVVQAGTLKEFAGYAQSLIPKHFEVLKTIPGVASIMRLYEAGYKIHFRQFGTVRAKDIAKITEWVKGQFEKEIEQGAIESKIRGATGIENYATFEDWEKRRALAVGRNLMSITMRAGEYISLSALPKRLAERYASFDQESIAKILNWISWVGIRWDLASSRGGVWILENAREEYLHSLEDKRKGQGVKLEIRNILGIDIDDLEAAGMLGVTGIYSGWRNELSILDPLLIYDGTQIKSVGREIGAYAIDLEKPLSGQDLELVLEIIRGTKININNLSDKDKLFIEEGLKKLRQQKITNLLEDIISRENLTIGFGALLNYGDTPLEIRKLIWEKVAKIDPLVMINFLSNMKTVEGSPFASCAITIQEDGSRRIGDLIVAKDEWEAFESKLVLNHERRMVYEVTEMKKLERGDIAGLATRSPREFIMEGLNEREQEWYQLIKLSGERLSSQLAGINFPNAPFFDDTPFEIIDYERLGREFLRRRLGGDWPAFSQGQEALASLINDPGKETHEAIKDLRGMVDALAIPWGSASAQDKVFPFSKTLLMFKKQIGAWREVPFLGGIANIFAKPVSVEQRFYGAKGFAVDEDGLKTFADDMLKAAVVRKEKINEKESQFDRLCKSVDAYVSLTNIRSWFKGRVRAKFRKYGPAGLIAFVIEFFKSLFGK